jgi:hypothetical protein
MSTWNRRVTATGDGLHLQVDEDTPNPNPQGRSDSSNDITVRGSDRPATIRYIGNGVTLSGIRMKDGGPVPTALAVAVAGPTMTLTDNGVAGTDYSYYLVGSYGTNSGIETEDPQIHNTP